MSFFKRTLGGLLSLVLAFQIAVVPTDAGTYYDPILRQLRDDYGLSGAATGATTALDNLASVAINTSLISDTAATDSLGTEILYWLTAFFGVNISFEGATDDAFQTIIAVTDPTADRTITFPDADGVPAILDGVSGGQTFTGGTASGDDIVLLSTSNATKGDIRLGDATTGLFFDETNSRVSIGGSENTTTIGGTAFGVKISSHTEGVTDGVDISAHRHSDTAGFGSHLVFTRSRGTEAAEAAVQSGDYLSRINSLGHDGTDYEIAGQIDVIVDDTVSAGVVPAHMSFFTMTTGGTLTEALRITNAQALSMDGGTTTISATEFGRLDGTAGALYNVGGTDVAITDGGTGASDAATAFANLKQAASTTASGVSELATTAETDTGTDTGRTITPDGLAGSYAGTKSIQVVAFDFTTDTATGDGKFYFHVPSALDGMNLVAVHAEVITAGTTGTTDIQIANVTDTTDMLSTVITIDSGETGSDTAATPAVIDATKDDVVENDLLRFDFDAISTTAAKGALITLEFRLP